MSSEFNQTRQKDGKKIRKLNDIIFITMLQSIVKLLKKVYVISEKPSYLLSDRTFLNCQPTFKTLVAHFRTNLYKRIQRVVCLQLNEIEDIQDIPLSERYHYQRVE